MPNKMTKFKKIMLAKILFGLFSPTLLLAQPLPQDGLSQKYFIPEGFQSALEAGLSVPVFLKVKDSNVMIDDASKNRKFAEATLILKNDKLYIQSLRINLSNKDAKLNAESETLLSRIKDVSFDEKSQIVVSKDIVLTMDIEQFILTMDVEPEAFGSRMTEKTNTLPHSNISGVTSILNYDVGVFHAKEKDNGANVTNSYLNYQLETGYRENNLTVDGSLYNLTDGDTKKTVLNEVMFKRDLDGRALKIGMANSWNFQSIGHMSALNAQKVYGISLTNQSRTQAQLGESSLTPIIAFLPEPGDVLVYRDGKLLTSQSFPVGSFEVDTSRYPAGVYDVEVEVVINGQVRSRNTQRVNKMLGNNNLSTDKLYWDVYAGYAQDTIIGNKDKDSRLGNSSFREKKAEDTYVAGFSLGKQFPVLSGLNLSTSNYVIKNNFYNETTTRLQVFDYGSIDWNLLFSGQGSYRNIVNVTANLPKGWGSLWVGREKSAFKENDVSIGDSDSYNYGANISLNAIFSKLPNLGTVNINKSRDKYNDSSNLNISHQINLYSNRFGTVSLQTGLQRTKNIGSQPHTNKYISLTMSIPLGSSISAGLASYNGDTNMNVSGRKDFQSSVVRNVGFTVSQRVHKEADRSTGDGFSSNAYMGLENKYISSNVNVARTTSGRLTGNLTARGSVGITGQSIVPSGKNSDAGIIIESNLDRKTSAMARVNGTTYKLTGKKNFIPLPAFETYKVELMNDKNAKETVVIGEGRQAEFTLYPGNIANHRPQIKQTVTVFGRLVDDQGQALPGIAINNHIGKTVTDEKGGFALDVDSQNPEINFLEKDVNLTKTESKNVCEIFVDIANKKGVMWLGDVSCFKLSKNKDINNRLSLNEYKNHNEK